MAKMYYAISGKMGSGKTHLAQLLVQDHAFEKLAFADEIKEAVAKGLEIPLDVVFKEKTVFRQVLQGAGQAARWYHGDTYWTDQVIQRVWALGQFKHDRLVLDDLRFPHEADRLRDEGFTLVRLESDPQAHEIYCHSKGYTHRDLIDISETALDEYDGWDIVIRSRPRDIYTVSAEFVAALGLGNSSPIHGYE